MTKRPSPWRMPRHSEIVVEQTLRGVSFTETAAQLGISRERVRQIAKVNGLTADAWRTEHRAQQDAARQLARDTHQRQVRAALRQRQHEKRVMLIQCVRDLCAELGEAPTMRQVSLKSGMFVTDMCRYFVGRMTGDWARRAVRRLYRLAGTEPRPAGRPGWAKR